MKNVLQIFIGNDGKCSRKEPDFALPSTRYRNYRQVSACLQQPETSRVLCAAKSEPFAPHFP